MNNNSEIENYLKYLILRGVSKSSLKYYKSDVNNFISWANGQKFSSRLVREYINSQRLITPKSTLNRRLSSLRSFATFKKADFMSNVGNIPHSKRSTKYNQVQNGILTKLVDKPKLKNVFEKIFFSRPEWYKRYHSFPLSNYIHLAILFIFCAVSGFALYDAVFNKTSDSLAFPTALTRPNRYMSFQGRLTNNLGNPITVATDVVFKLYDDPSAGSILWDSDTCSITPDSDGIFSILLGTSTNCPSATEIASSVFSENASVWVGVKVGADAEATPRIQIATVAYALNAETLQGFPAGTGVSTVPYIDSTGKIAIAAASPTIESSSGTFAVTGQAMTISTANTTDGIITINPDGAGTLDLTFEGTSAGGGANGFVNASNANITSGALYGGTVASAATGYNFIDFQSGVSPVSKFSVNNAGDITSAGDLNINGDNITADGVLTVDGAGLTLQTTGVATDITINAVDQIILTDFTNGGSGCSALETDSSGNLTCGTDNDSGGVWTDGSGITYLTDTAEDLAIGGSSLAASIFSIDESAATFYFASDNSANPTLTFEATDGDTGDFGFNTNDAFYFNGANVGIGDTTPASLLTVGNGDLFQVDSSGNIKGPTLVLGTGTIAPTDRLFDINTSTALTNVSTYTGSVQRTVTGTLTGNTNTVNLYNQLNINATDAGYAHTANGIQSYAILSDGNTIDNMRAGFFESRNTSTALSPDTGATATNSAGIISTAYNNAAGTVTNQYGGNFQSFNNNASGAVTTAYGSAGLSYTLVDGSTIGTAYGAYGQSYELATQSTGGITTNYGGFFQAQDANTSYGLYAQGIQNTANVETFTNLYGIRSDCATNNANTTVSYCYGINSSISETAGTITQGYAGYFQSAAAMTNAYGVASVLSGASTTANYAFYGSVANGTTDWGIYLTGEDKNYFSGSVGIGDTTPASLLTVGNGDLFQVNSSGIIAAIDGVAHTIDDVGGNLTLTSNSTAVSVADDLYLSSGLSTFGTAVTDDTIEATKFCTGDGETNCVTDFSSLSAGASLWTDGGTYIYPTASEVLGNSASAGANKIAGLYLGDSSPLVFGADNDITYSFSGSVLGVASGTNDINFDSDTNTLYIDSSASSVGIGNTAPGARLHISSHAGGYAGNLLKFDSAADPTNYSMTLRSEVTTALVKYHFDLVNAATSYPATLTLDRNTIGIATTAPDAALEINHATGDNLRLTYNDADGTAAAYTDFSLASDGDLTIDSAGGAIVFASGDIFTLTGGTISDATDEVDINDDLAVSGILQVGGTAVTTHSRLGTATTGHSGTLSSSSDLLLTDLEIDGKLFLDGGEIDNAGGTAAITLTSAMDTGTNILSAGNWMVDNTATGNVGQAALIVDQHKAGDLFTASVAGTTKMAINPTGDLSIGYSGTTLPTTTNPLMIYNHSTTNVASINTAGLLTLASDVAVNGGDITSTATTFNLLNATVTTLNLGGAATAIELGAATGTTSVNNAITIDGNTTLGNLNTADTLTGNLLTSAITSGATTQNAFSLTASSLTTGSALVVTGPTSTGVTDHFVKLSSDIGASSSLLNLNPDFSGSGVAGYGIYNIATDSTTNSNSNYGYYGTLSLTGNAAKIGTGLSSAVSSSSTVADDTYAGIFTATTTGAVTSGTQDTYGIYSSATSTNNYASSSDTRNIVYGGYFRAGGTIVNNSIDAYGLYVGNGTMSTSGNSTNTGLYVENITGADNNFAAIFAGGNVGIGDTTPASLLTVGSGELFQVDSSGNISSKSTSTFGDGTGADTATFNVGTGAFNIVQQSTSGAFMTVSTGSVTQTGATYGYNLNLGSFTTGAFTLNGILLQDPLTDDATGIANGINVTGANWDRDISFQNSEYIDNNVDGTVAVTANTGTLIFDVNGRLQFDATSDDNERLCHTGADGTTLSNVYIEDCTVSGEDIAEWAIINTTSEPGDIVYTVGAYPSDPQLTLKSLTSNRYQRATGIISTNPFIDILGDEQYKNVNNAKPIALAGRVPGKISTENGIISVGDGLTPSSIPGVLMKATHPSQILGFAEENYDGSQRISSQVISQEIIYNSDLDGRKPYNSDPSLWPLNVGKIMVDLKVGYYDPDLALNDAGQVTLAGNLVNGYQVVTPVGVAQKIIAAVSVVTANLKAGIAQFDKVETNLISPIANSDLIIDLQPDNNLPASDFVIKGENDENVVTITADGSADFAGDVEIDGTLYADKIESSKLSEIESLLMEVEGSQKLLAESANWNVNTATESGQFKDLFVTGQTALTSLFVSDLLTTKNINSLDGPLGIQTLASAAIEIMAGKITIDTEGNTAFLGNVEIAGSLTVNNIIIANPDPVASQSAEIISGEITTNSIAGKAILPANTTDLIIKNDKVNENTLIYVTPTSSTQNKVLYVKSKDLKAFTVGFSEAIDSDTEFNWWIIELK